MSLKFGTSGLRGLSTDLAGPAAALYATAFARHLAAGGSLRPGGRILIGRDFRPSSPLIARIAAAAFLRAGFRPVDCGTLPTPALALHGMETGAPAIMVTGSHIPADRNGIKFYRPDGEIDKTDEAAIMAGASPALAAEIGAWFATADTDAPEMGREKAEALGRYRARFAALVPPGTLAGQRIGLYQHSSVGRDLYAEVLAAAGATVIPFARSERFIPVDTEAVSPETRALLCAAAADHAPLTAIVSADGDADRPLMTDETGAVLRGDLIGLLTARHLGARVIVTPVTSNSGIDALAGTRTIRTAVGSPFVIAAMQAAVAAGEGGVIGFEANGGVMTATALAEGRLAPLPTRDGLLPLLAVLAAAARAGLPVSALAAREALPVAAGDRLENFATTRSALLMAHLASGPEALDAFVAPFGRLAAVDRTDGLRLTLDDGRILHLRPSGNAPEMRCYVEAGDEESAKALLSQGLDRIAEVSAGLM